MDWLRDWNDDDTELNGIEYQCPNCYHNKLRITKWGDKSFQIECKCGLATPRIDEKAEAIKYWLWMHDSLG